MKRLAPALLALALASSGSAQSVLNGQWEYGRLTAHIESDKGNISGTLFRNFLTWTAGNTYLAGFEDDIDTVRKFGVPLLKTGVFASLLDGLGSAGWELITVTNQRPSLSDYYLEEDTYYFKRRAAK